MKTKKKKKKQKVCIDLKRQLGSSHCYQKVGNIFITLLHIQSNMMIYTCVFCISEFDEDEDEEDEDEVEINSSSEDNDDDNDEDYEDK